MLMITPAGLLGVEALGKDGDRRDGSPLPATPAPSSGEEVACNWAGDSCPPAGEGPEGRPAATDPPAQ